MRSRAGGFTLMELLVVFVILGSVSVLLAQSFSVFLKAFYQTQTIETTYIKKAMADSWFRDSLSFSVASQDEEFGFKGNSKSITAFSIGPLNAPPGFLEEIHWNIEFNDGNSVLSYKEGKESSIVVNEWPESSAVFYYRGSRSEWLTQWPPSSVPVGLLPDRLKLTVINHDGDIREEIYVAMKMRREPRFDYRDYL